MAYTRSVLNGVFWVLGTGAQWSELPEKYPPYQTCHRRFQRWARSGRLKRALKPLARLLYEQGKLNLVPPSVRPSGRKPEARRLAPTHRGACTKGR